ncbi:MAG TPA: hypothetical protein VFL64_01550 [Rhizobacter sp.]|nr:hypothetical protein [Rhizobacter sp.]
MWALKFCRTLGVLCALVLVAACGGAGEDEGDDGYTPTYAGSSWSGTVGAPMDGTWTFTVDGGGAIAGTVTTSRGTFTLQGGLLNNGVLDHLRATSSQGTVDIIGTVSGSALNATWNGTWGATGLSATSGAFNGSRSSGGGGGSASGGSCPWDATAFYNLGQVVSYNGATYTARQRVTPLGLAAATISNPAVNSTYWAVGGTCGPTPYVTVESATCTRNGSSGVIQMSGKALGGGTGDAIVAYTNATDRSGATENNFGLVNRSYSMACAGGGFTSNAFSSTSSPIYSVCRKNQASNSPTSWTSTHTVVLTSIRPTIAYVSMGEPLRANNIDPGSIILGYGDLRSTGVAITGDCQ